MFVFGTFQWICRNGKHYWLKDVDTYIKQILLNNYYIMHQNLLAVEW